MSAVWAELAALIAAGGEGALVTVAHTERSAYQREGAKMLYRVGAEAVGTISGGCLEADVFEHCTQAIGAGLPCYVRYENGSDHDTLLGLGSGCSGTIELLIEPIALWRSPEMRGFLSEIRRRFDAGDRFVLATALRYGGIVPSMPPRLLFDGRTAISVDSAGMRETLREEAEKALFAEARRPSRKVETLSGELLIEVLADVVVPPARLVVFGAGEDARPLVSIASASGMLVTVVDWRSELLIASRFPDAFARICQRPEEFPRAGSLAGAPAVLLMSHNYLADRAALERLLESGLPLSYLGVLGPRSRTARLLGEVAGSMNADVRTPAGLDLGADTPGEIALSIVAEILSVQRRRSGRPLRDVHDSASDDGAGQES